MRVRTLMIFLLIPSENIHCGNSLEAPWQGASMSSNNVFFHGEIQKVKVLYSQKKKKTPPHPPPPPPPKKKK